MTENAKRLQAIATAVQADETKVCSAWGCPCTSDWGLFATTKIDLAERLHATELELAEVKFQLVERDYELQVGLTKWKVGSVNGNVDANMSSLVRAGFAAEVAGGRPAATRRRNQKEKQFDGLAEALIALGV